MSNLNDLINKIKARDSNRNQNRVKLLPYMPTEPNQKKVCQNRLKRKNEKVPSFMPQKQGESDEMWKMNWLVEYDAARRQMEPQKKEILEKSKENEFLKDSYNSQKKSCVNSPSGCNRKIPSFKN